MGSGYRRAALAIASVVAVWSSATGVESLAGAKEGTARRAQVCPSPLMATRQPGLHDPVCASVQTARSSVVGRRRAAGATVRLRRSSGPLRGAEPEHPLTGLDVGLPPAQAGSDSYTVATGDGTIAVLTFPEGSLVQNYPGLDTYDPSLPIGMLVLDEGHPPRAAIENRATPAAPALSENGLTQYNSSCATVTSNSDGTNTSGAAYYSACYRFYKPTDGDASPTWKWRQVFSTGSGHGGNFSHHLRQTRNHTWLERSAVYDDWEPMGSDPFSACDKATVSLGVSGAGFSGSISHTFDVCPDSYGVQFFDADANPPKFQYGWDGDKGCGGGNCSYIGNSGGFQAKLPQNEVFSTHLSVGISWGM